jgi:hypothetical protein
MNPTEYSGTNRTGIQVSLADSTAMQQHDGVMAGEVGDDTALDQFRSSYIAEADPVGSAPHVGNADLLLDKLGERMAFERTGTRLYDALISKCRSAPDQGSVSMSLGELTRFRDDEARHFLLVADAIDELSGDPTTQTPSADLAGVESMGLCQVITDPRTTIAQCLHAILVAELTDNAGWETLIALAMDQNQQGFVADFTDALNEEKEHLRMIQAWYEQALGIGVGMTGVYAEQEQAFQEPPLA